MASGARRDVARGRNVTSEAEVLEILEDSDVQLSGEDDDQDPTYQEPPVGGFQRFDSSDSSSSSKSDDLPLPASPALSYSSCTRRPAARGLRRGRGSRGPRRTIQSGQTQTSSPSRSQPTVVDKWIGSFEPEDIDLHEPAYLPVDDSEWTFQQLFEQYVDDNILLQIVECTNRTAILTKGRSLGLTVKELKVYIGITMIMAALQYPQMDMYWYLKWKQSVIASAMTRARFYLIRTSLKVVFDPEITSDERKKDKIWKIRPLFERVRQGCLCQARTTKMSIDEMIIPFTGQCSIRQYNPNKPNPLGLKVFVLATPQGLVIDFEIYQGDITLSEIRQLGFGLGEAVVLRLTDALASGHHLFFDRFFTTTKLCNELLQRGFHATGTITKNRLPKDCVLEDDKVFMKRPRGQCEVKVRDDGKIAVTRWMDNKPVMLISTHLSNRMTDECERWSKKNKVYEKIKRPEVIKQHNENMGGVDLVDRMLAVCPTRSRTKKCTFRVISHMIDLAVANSYLQFKHREQANGAKKVMGIREFKIELDENLISGNLESSDDDDSVEELQPKHKKRKTAIVPIPTKEKRQNKAEHIPQHSTKQNRCRLEGCNKKTTVFCKKNSVHLCFTVQRNCFEKFHVP